MIIEADITNHPKFVRLKSLVGDIALEYLVRLWGHCQQSKRGQFWPGATSDYVEVVCTGRSQRGKIFKALLDCRWVHERENGVEIHEWNKYNASLVARWNRDQKPAQTFVQVSAQPSAQTPEGNGGEWTGVDTTQQEVSGGVQPPRLTPSLLEAIKWFKVQGSVYTSEQVGAVHASFEATKLPTGAWRWGKGEVTDWKMAMTSRLIDRHQKKT